VEEVEFGDVGKIDGGRTMAVANSNASRTTGIRASAKEARDTALSRPDRRAVGQPFGADGVKV
jgi:hypothetical protein